MKCNNCGKEKCDCAKYEKEIQELKSKHVPMTHEEKMKRVKETVRKWHEKKEL